MKYSLIIALLLGLIGCTNSNPQGRLLISGEATLNGQPLANGNISFEPSGSQSVKTQSGGQIKNGKYSIAAADGLVEGEYVASIRSMEEIPGTQKNTGNPLADQPQYGSVFRKWVKLVLCERSICGRIANLSSHERIRHVCPKYGT
ncbi:MAG: hypothetical protein LBT05_15815, partial [Planctomycetaceae bacterium]|nr:hypothetical protein [Planctomycetaceae bacterium]